MFTKKTNFYNFLGPGFFCGFHVITWVSWVSCASWVSFGFLGFPGFHIFLGFSWILLGLAEFSFWILEGLHTNLSS